LIADRASKPTDNFYDGFAGKDDDRSYCRVIGDSYLKKGGYREKRVVVQNPLAFKHCSWRNYRHYWRYGRRAFL
jgi:hypothetical protein